MADAPHCISYPKSGRTWLRVMLRELPGTETIVFHHDRFEFSDGTKPPHNFNVEERLRAYPPDLRLIYLERDPRDVLVSLFHQVTGRFRDFFGYDEPIGAFIRDPYFGATSLLAFRQMWAQILEARPFLKLTYEDLHADTSGSLRTVANYLGLDVDTAQIDSALAAGRIETMREVELSGAFPEPWLRPRMGHTKVRRGIVGGHRDELAAEDVEYLNSVFGAP